MAEELTAIEVGPGIGAGAIGVGSLLGLCAGFGLGYYVAKARLEKSAQEEVEEAREYYRAAKLAFEATTKEPVDDIVTSLGYRPASEEEEVAPEAEADPIPEDPAEAPVVPEEQEDPLEEPAEVDTIIHSETEMDDSWDWPEEMRLRGDKTRPYVIHQEEVGEEEYMVVSYNWYPVNELLTDERDDPVDFADRDATVGEDNLKKFGHGTGNPSIVNVRNDQLQLDIEICVTEGDYYAEAKNSLLHGFDVTRMPRRRKFDDE